DRTRKTTELPLTLAARTVVRMPGGKGVSEDINVLALVKGRERYIFLYDDEHRTELLRTLGRFASSPDLSFSWYDAAVLSQRVRRETTPEQETRSSSRFRLPQPTDQGRPELEG